MNKAIKALIVSIVFIGFAVYTCIGEGEYIFFKEKEENGKA